MKIQLLNILVFCYLMCGCSAIQKSSFCLSGSYGSGDDAKSGTFCLNPKRTTDEGYTVTNLKSTGEEYAMIPMSTIKRSNSNELINRSKLNNSTSKSISDSEPLPKTPVKLFVYFAKNPVVFPDQQP